MKDGQYSYWCKDCGFTSFSSDKREIAKVRKAHTRPLDPLGRDSRSNRCGLVPVGDGTIARLDLVGKLKEQTR